MPALSCRKGQGLAHRPTDPLPKRIIPPFNMRRFPCLFADAPMRFTGKHVRVGVPEIAETHASSVRNGNPTPQPSTRAALRSPIAKAMTWRVRRRKTIQSHRFPARVRTNGQTSSNSSTSSGRAGANVFFKGAGHRLFFYPCRQRFPRHAEGSGNAAHARPFLRGAKDFVPARLVIAAFGRQDACRPTVFAYILLTAATISAIFDDIVTATFAALTLNGCDHHLTIFFKYDVVDKNILLSFKIYHYPFLICSPSLPILSV